MIKPEALNPSTLSLGLLCLVAGGLVAVELMPPAGPGALATPPAPVPGKAPRAEADFSLPPLSHYQVIAERPLFLKSRQPAPKDAGTTDTPAASEGQLSQFALTAVVIAPEQRFAILRAQAEGKLSRVASGQEFQGWTLRDVDGDGVVFARSDKEEHLPLLRKTPDKIKQAARRAALLDRRRQQVQPQPPQQPQPPPQGQPQPPRPGVAPPGAAPAPPAAPPEG
jgi:hypothetical protein